MNFDRFANVLGDEYNLLKESVPHHDEFQDEVRRVIKDYCSHLQGEAILVVEGGTGTGLTSLRILDADERIGIIAIDNEEKTLRQARVVLAEYGNRVEFKKGDLLETLQKMVDVSVDTFASVYTIHNPPSDYRSSLFKEIARVLKCGGLFVNGDKYARNDEALHKKDLEEQIKAFEIYDTLGNSNLKNEWIKHYQEDEKIKITENEQIEILKCLNFNDIKTVYRKRMEAIYSNSVVHNLTAQQKVLLSC